MAAGGLADTTRVLVRHGDKEGFLNRGLEAVGDLESVDRLVGIAGSEPARTWLDAIERSGIAGVSGTIIDVTGIDPATPTRTGPAGFATRDLSGSSLGDVGIAAVESIAAGDPTRPAVLIDSVGALADDPGTRFKFLDLLGRRVAKDDGYLLAYEGDPLPDHECHTFAEVFDTVEDEVPV